MRIFGSKKKEEKKKIEIGNTILVQGLTRTSEDPETTSDNSLNSFQGLRKSSNDRELVFGDPETSSGNYHKLKTLWHKTPSLILIVLFAAVLIIFGKEWITLKPQFGGDWHFMFNENIKDFRNVVQIWDSSEGLGQSTANRVPLEIMNVWLAFFNFFTGLGFKAAEILFWFLPFVISSFVSTYYLAKRFTYEKRSAAISAFFYTLNPYVLVLFSEAGHINVLVAYALIPLLLITLQNFLEKRNYSNLFLYITTLTAIMFYDIRLGYISFILQGIFIVSSLFVGLKLNVSKLLSVSQWLILAGFLFLIINLYWIAALFIVPKDTLLPPGFENSDWVNRLSFQDISHGIFFDHPFLTENGVTYFRANNIRPIFLVITGIIFLGLAISKSKQFQKALPWIATWVIGIFFLKGNNPPFGNIYVFLYENFPGFSMLREPQKWYFMVALPYVILLGMSVSVISNRLMNKASNKYLGELYKIANLSLHWIVVVIICISLTPLFNNKLGENFRARSLPEYATKVEDLVNQDQDEFYRVLWIPKVTAAAYKTNTNPRVDAFVEIAEFLNTENDQDVYDFFFSDKFKVFLNSASIRYIVFPNEEGGLQWFSKDFKVVIREFEKIDYLKPVYNGQFAIFENTNYKPLFYSSNSAILTDDNLQDLNTEVDKLTTTDVIQTTKQISPAVTNFSDKNYNLSSVKKVSQVTDGKIETQFETIIPSNFDTQDNDDNRYYKVGLAQVNGKYRVELVNIQEEIKIDSEYSAKIVKDKIEIPGEFNLDSEVGTVVRIGDEYFRFSKEDLENGVLKNAMYLPFADEKVDELDVKVYQEGKTYYQQNFNNNFKIDLQDCGNITSTSLEQNGIIAEFVKDSFEGGQAVLLQANKQNGCITEKFKIADKTDLLVAKAAYKSIEGESPEFCVFDFKNNKCAIRHALLDASDIEWKSDETFFNVENNADEFSFYFYANAELSRTTNLYDDLSVSSLNKVAELKLNLEVREDEEKNIIEESYIVAEKHKFEYRNEIISPIKINNNSFEKPINYQLYVSDCANADKTPLNQNQITAVQRDDATDGRFSLEISGINHSACYSLPVGKLTSNYSYYLNFDLKTSFETLTRICIFDRIQSRCDYDKVFDESTDWQKIQAIFDTLGQSGSYDLYVYSYSTQGDGNFYKSIFDNVKLYRVPKNFVNRFKAFSNNELDKRPELFGAPKIEFEQISKTRYIVRAKDVKADFILNFNTQFDTGWKIYKSKQSDLSKNSLITKLKLNDNFSLISDEYHVKTNSFMNGWLISDEGDITFVIDYKQESTLLILTAISSASFGLLALIYFGIVIFRKRK